MASPMDQGHECYLEVLESAVNAIEAKDVYTRGHSKRVALYSEYLAAYLNLQQNQQDLVKVAALLHDIGKIGVSELILNKRGSLTEGERADIKRHPVIGAQILEPMSYMRDIIPVILHHHERFDGKGYPQSLAGHAAPLEARIIGVADAFDAMTSTRSYRSAMGVDEAMKELKTGSGSQFDPQVVDAFLSLEIGLLRGIVNSYGKLSLM